MSSTEENIQSDEKKLVGKKARGKNSAASTSKSSKAQDDDKHGEEAEEHGEMVEMGFDLVSSRRLLAIRPPSSTLLFFPTILKTGSIEGEGSWKMLTWAFAIGLIFTRSPPSSPQLDFETFARKVFDQELDRVWNGGGLILWG